MNSAKSNDPNLSHFKNLILQVKELKSKYLELIDENNYLKLKLQENQKEIENQKKIIENLETQLKVRNLASQTIVSESQAQFIEDLLMDIDACLALLEKT
jgi:regulator of replication initiation timing